ncbi:MAG: methyltransferase domain-containing protein [Desulfuromonadaceae bacterium]|nr:methyltransferase domain-containing protein [Desulfuromonadaceae bacterium]
MKKEIQDYWLHQASVQENDEIDALRKVLDPADVKGVKNSYIDGYLKCYLQESLQPEIMDTLLEIGSGIGRLTEYMAQFVHTVYGIDIIDKFIDDCRANVRKRANTIYLKSNELGKLGESSVNKMYIVWVLMYLFDRNEIIETLTNYRKALPHLKTAVVLEQVKSCSQTEYRDGRINCYYRTIEEYTEIFRASGFNIQGYVVMGERHHGPIYKLIHVICNFLPKRLANRAECFFHFDRKLMGDNAGRTGLINSRKPTDIVFRLEVA